MMGARVLYVVYWGALEPLGQSLVLPSLVKLAEGGAQLTLLTFEKPNDLLALDRLVATRAQLEAVGARWVTLGYHKRPKIPATAWDIVVGVARSVLEIRRMGANVVHGRTFIGGLVGRAAAALTGVAFVYHNEGFYPDEQVDSGVFRERSVMYRCARRLEGLLYDSADGLIVLSRRARAVVVARTRVARRSIPVIVVPSVVNLDVFRVEPERCRETSLRLVYLGSIGTRYAFEELAAFFSVARAMVPHARLRVLTPASRAIVGDILTRQGISEAAWSCDQVPYDQVPGELAQQSVGLSFLRHGRSEFGGSPTKVGEYWASGLPVVSTPGSGDLDEIIAHERVGVILRGRDEAAYARATTELTELLTDADLSRRCRSAAARHFSLSAAVNEQLTLYSAVVNGLPRTDGRPPDP